MLDALVAWTGVAKNEIDGIFLGAVEMMEAHPGTAIPFLVGFPPTVGLSVERASTTAMMSIHVAAMCVETGQGDAYVAGGLDSITHFRIPLVRDGTDMSSRRAARCSWR